MNRWLCPGAPRIDRTHLRPVAVRYAYTPHPDGCNLDNNGGLPASPFSTCGD